MNWILTKLAITHLTVSDNQNFAKTMVANLYKKQEGTIFIAFKRAK
jgi:hypothetical protein